MDFWPERTKTRILLAESALPKKGQPVVEVEI